MSPGFWFWLIMVLWLFFSWWRAWPQPEFRYLAGGHVLLFLLFAILGWHAFGNPFDTLVR